MRRRSLDQLPQYGALAGLSGSSVLDLIHRLIGRGLLALSDGEYPVLMLTEAGRESLESGDSIFLPLPKEAPSAGRRERKRKQEESKGEMTERPELYEQLRALRARLARRLGVPAYVVFTDRALREMAGYLPLTEEALLTVNGVGRAKLERYGAEVLQLLRDYAQERGEN